MHSPQKRDLTAGEAAAYLGISKPAFYRSVDEGRIRGWRAWSRGDLKFRIEDLEALRRGETAVSA